VFGNPGAKTFDSVIRSIPLAAAIHHNDSNDERYRAVRDKHQEFCQKQAIYYWNDITKKSIESYASSLSTQKYSTASL
jgi:hypothetical protein